MSTSAIRASDGQPALSEEDAGNTDRFFAALAGGDLDQALDCLSPDARIWHSFDGIAQDRSAAKLGWRALVSGFEERAFVDVRRIPFPGGLVQQHMMIVRTASGKRMGWPCCVILKFENGLICRIEEYLDRAGKLEVADVDEPATPGL